MVLSVAAEGGPGGNVPFSAGTAAALEMAKRAWATAAARVSFILACFGVVNDGNEEAGETMR